MSLFKRLFSHKEKLPPIDLGLVNTDIHSHLIPGIDDGAQKFKERGGWLGITDKYWAAVLVPDQQQSYDANFSGAAQNKREFYYGYC